MQFNQDTAHHVGKRTSTIALLVGLLIIMLAAATVAAAPANYFAVAAAPANYLVAVGGPPPEMISYQGNVSVSGTAHDGTGYFKFAVVDAAGGDGTTNYWANDGTASGEPSAEVALTVGGGLFHVMLGDTSLAGMTQALSSAAFSETDTYLRVWFSATSGGPFQALDPNQRIGSSAYALRAADAATLDGMAAAAFAPADIVPTGAVMTFNLATCPAGWSELIEAQGRALVGMPAGGTLKGTVGTALADNEDRSHIHNVDPASFASASGGVHSHSVDPPAAGTSAVNLTTNPPLSSPGPIRVDGHDGGSYYFVPHPSHRHDLPSHGHSVDIGSFASSSDGNHDHAVDVPATDSSPASTSDVMPYLQLLVCEKS